MLIVALNGVSGIASPIEAFFRGNMHVIGYLSLLNLTAPMKRAKSYARNQTFKASIRILFVIPSGRTAPSTSCFILRYPYLAMLSYTPYTLTTHTGNTTNQDLHVYVYTPCFPIQWVTCASVPSSRWTLRLALLTWSRSPPRCP
jgi:hypothetical protein